MENTEVKRKLDLFVNTAQKNKSLKSSETSMFEGKNIHSSPVDGKLLCSYSEKVCMQRRLNGFAFCIRHILEDKGAPFKQCQFFAKYNKSRCINPVPILEKRDYCNSHMQVLGIIPKKVKKKKDCERNPSSNNAKDVNNKICKDTNHNSQNAKKKSLQKNNLTQPKTPPNINRSFNIHVNTDKQPAEMLMPPLRWRPYNQTWKKLLKKRNKKHWTNITCSSIEHFKKQYRRSLDESKDLFKTYVFEVASDDSSDAGEIPWQTDAVPDSLILCQESPVEEMRSRLKHQSAQLKQSIKAGFEEQRMTYAVLNALVNAAKVNTAATANILNINNDHKQFRNRRVANPNAQCAAKEMPNLRCSKTALPYSRFCVKHIGNDDQQVLFGKCIAKFAAGSQCSVPVVDLLNERPLCDEHSLKMMISSNKEGAATSNLPTKKSKKSEKTEKTRTKSVQPKRNLKAQLQKKFAIPKKPMKKTNSHIMFSTVDEKNSPDKNQCFKLTAKCTGDRKLETLKQEKKETENLIIAPRSYDTVDENGSSSANDLSFDMDPDSLSSPSLSDNEAHYPLMNMGRNHQDNFTFDDEEDLLSTSTFTMTSISRISNPRDVISPTLMQLSTESMQNRSLSSLCSPPKMSMDKPFFGSPSPLKREPDSDAFKQSINHVFDVQKTANRGERVAHGNYRIEEKFPAQTSLLNSERYNLGVARNSNPATPNHAFNASMSTASTSSSNWTSKFTLQTQNDHVSSIGFIRVGPSTNSIYSPPFTSPPLHSKTTSFKFDNNAKSIDNDFLVHPRDPPPYSTAVQEKTLLLDKKYDTELPLQKVNPDIFLSTMFTVPSSTSS